MAEAVFRDLLKKRGLEDKIEVDSAGTSSWHVGEPCALRYFQQIKRI